MSDALQQFLNKNSARANTYHDIIEDMMDDYDAYHYAESTLLGILDYIDKNNTITDAQVQAIENIKSNPSKHG